MAQATKIQWTDFSVNPIRARHKATGKVGHYCEKISPGCALCYASRMQQRFEMPAFPGHGKRSDDVEVFFDDAKLTDVIRRRKPTKYFWCDMTDMFGEWVSFDWIDKCFATMAMTPQHVHQVLTKRPERMAEYCGYATKFDNLEEEIMRTAFSAGREDRAFAIRPTEGDWPLPNVWLGVSCEDQQRADDRIPHLLRCPAAIRFLSCEPLLGPIDLGQLGTGVGGAGGFRRLWISPVTRERIDWVIVGGESGRGARPCDVGWIRSIVQQCRDAGVACFVKQLGALPTQHCGQCGRTIGRVQGGFVDACGPTHTLLIAEMVRIHDTKGGDISEFPNDLRVREFPHTSELTEATV